MFSRLLPSTIRRNSRNVLSVRCRSTGLPATSNATLFTPRSGVVEPGAPIADRFPFTRRPFHTIPSLEASPFASRNETALVASNATLAHRADVATSGALISKRPFHTFPCPSADLSPRSAADTGAEASSRPAPGSRLGNRWSIQRVVSLVGFGVVCFGVVIYGSDVVKQAVLNRMMDVFEKGEVTCLPPQEFPIDRSDLHADIDNELLRPKWTPQWYYLVVGKVGAGKTIAMTKAISDLPEPRGVVYVNFDGAPPSDVVGTIAEAVGYRRPLSLLDSIFIPNEREQTPDDILQGLRTHLELMARQYKKKHDGRLPVLVIDTADQVAKHDEPHLLALQDMAKYFAYEKLLRVVFVSGEGDVLHRFRSTSLTTRFAKAFEIPDVLHDAAVNHIVAMGVSTDRADNAVTNICGGNVIALDDYAHAVKKGQSDEEIICSLNDRTKVALLRVLRTERTSTEISSKTEEALGTLFSSLAKRCQLVPLLAKMMVGSDVYAALLKENILEADSGTVSFHAPHIRELAKTDDLLKRGYLVKK